MEIRTDRKTVEALVDCQILEIRDADGEVISLEQAEQNPEEVMVHSMSDKDFALYIEDDDLYILKEEVRHL